MASSPARQSDTIIVDSIHGDIHLREVERRVIDTASFQRLRHLKQLGMAQVTYPNTTHTRFAHSIGVLGIMAKITDIAKHTLQLDDGKVEDIRLAGLLHDIGHYPNGTSRSFFRPFHGRRTAPLSLEEIWPFCLLRLLIVL